MRIQDSEIVTASCVSTMDGKDVNGGSIPITDIKYSHTCNDSTNSNGILSPPSTPSTTTPSENDYAPIPSGSGRFKFFKDGKFILELWHQKNGERMLWIPVSKNPTYWPSIGHCTPRQESSASLSVSDDNSSIQSSPWQRDHGWKQAVPRKNINRELEFSMHFLRSRKIRFSSLAIRRKRRRPYESITLDVKEVMKYYKEEKSVKNELKCDKEVKYEDKAKKILNIIQKLSERKIYESNSNSYRIDPGIVSPRKRILKELEKVSLEELGNSNKKHRARTVFNNVCSNTVTVATGTISGPTVTTCTAHTAVSASSTKSTNSHSISSILSRDEEPSFLRNLLKSPNDSSSECKSSFTAESPASNDVRIIRPPDCSTPVTPLSYSSKPYPPPVPSFIPSTYLYHAAHPYNSPPVSNHPPYYSAFPSNYRDSSMWPLPSVSSLPRQSIYPSTSIPAYPVLSHPPWVPVAHSSFQSYSVTENGTDVPLNLSKH